MLKLFTFSFTAMGGAGNLLLYAKDSSQASSVAADAEMEIERIEQRYSRYRSGNLMSRINTAAAEGKSVEVDDETSALINYAFACYKHSNALFDISSGVLRKAWDFATATVPSTETIARLLPHIGLDKIRWQKPLLEFTVPGMELDFGGIAKEYAADRAASICASRGITHGLVELSGDIHVIGPHPDHSPWQIGITHPQHPDKTFAEIPVHKGGIAGSGDYARHMDINRQRYSHLLNPITGEPVQGLSAVNAKAESCMVAGSITTIAMLKGKEGANWLNDLGLAHFWFGNNGEYGGSLEQLMKPSSATHASNI